jgi:hypothetical protein
LTSGDACIIWEKLPGRLQMRTSWITFLVSFVSESKWQKQTPKKLPKNTLKPLLSKGFVISPFLSGKFIFLHFWVIFVPYLYLW